MDPLDYLSIRFHFRGDFHHDGTEWQYVGGKHGMSMVHLSKLSLEELKNNLADHVACSEKALKNSTLHWKFPGLIRDGVMTSALVMLHDQQSVLDMAEHITDAGVMDIYTKISDEFSEEEANDWEYEHAKEHHEYLEDEQQQPGEEQQQHVEEEQQQHGVYQQSNAEEQQKNSEKEWQHNANSQGQHTNPNAEEHTLEPEAWQYSKLYYQPSSSNAKLPVKRGSSQIQPPKRTNNAAASSSRAPPNPAKRAKKQAPPPRSSSQQAPPARSSSQQAPPARSSSQQHSHQVADRTNRRRSRTKAGSSSQPAPGNRANSSSNRMQVPYSNRLQWLLTGER